MTLISSRDLRRRPTSLRRPPGGPAPLDRPIFTSGRLYLAITAGLVLAWALVTEIPAASRWFSELDEHALRWIAEHRSEPIAERVATLVTGSSGWLWRFVRWTTIGVLVLSRRLRHLAVYAAIILGVTAVMHVVIDIAERPPPLGAFPVSRAPELTHPSRAVIELSLSVVGAIYTLVPRGRLRNRAKIAAGFIVGAFAGSRLYLGLEHPTDLAAALILGAAIPVVLFRYLTPNHVFPIRYGRRHDDDLPADLRARVRSGMQAQLGWSARTIDTMRPGGSAGSTPLRIELAALDTDTPQVVFGKLYSLAHLRSDRWYKIARAVLYGRLEDEAPFADIRQLVEHEDYMLRLAGSAGLPVPRVYGVVEVLQGREYLLVIEWIQDGVQLSDVLVNDDLLSQGFAVVEGLWRAGIAHRDIKPANLVVAGGRLHLVDFSFGEIRPSAWRQAVDLGTMALSLGAYSEPEAVLSAASARFTAVELAEAIAASHSVTIPAQLRSVLRHEAPELHRALSTRLPAIRPVRVQRWSAPRLLLTIALVSGSFAALLLMAFNVTRAGLL